jgi:hypothetical protein
MSASNFNKLQRVQNALARTVLCLRKYDHIRHALAELHWLPISQRVTYKMATTTFKVLNTSQQQYLRDLLVMYVPRSELRSSTQQLLQANRVRTTMANVLFATPPFLSGIACLPMSVSAVLSTVSNINLKRTCSQLPTLCELAARAYE